MENKKMNSVEKFYYDHFPNVAGNIFKNASVSERKMVSKKDIETRKETAEKKSNTSTNKRKSPTKKTTKKSTTKSKTKDKSKGDDK